ncbi:endonuclease NucS [Nanchangia anserum]|uniref:Endonuclease NucS n=1 Tax=Nanchangia anserum TaxID=2692125 RepID=A0A8I0GH65_9ACTO|nr:endonuclease NucS [Nanchangia anserum]MBD3689929.1 endonuclease NucS [Nanchangia anserum]QOX82256.1 endonuclease NucS [Nanchangia anserum]
MRVCVAECSVEYSGRLDAHLPRAIRLVMVKADGSVLIHADGGSYKPLNWMAPPCTLSERAPDEDEVAGEVERVWEVRQTKTGDMLRISIHEMISESTYDLGVDPGLVKDGVEKHLQALLADSLEGVLGMGWRLVRREYPTPVGPVDLLAIDPEGIHVAIEVKRRGEIDGVEQLTRYLELLRRDPRLADIRGMFAAQEIKPQARTLAEDRGIACVVLDYDAMRGMDDPDSRLF